ncbi:MAG TPA: DinB family protein [Cryomorphaceae bacterium]|nr:DinB family protein [Cryomorphaceae bacterium]
MNKDLFLKDLSRKLSEIDDALNKFSREDEEALQQHPAEGNWSALECIEHLHRYNAFYLPEFQKSIHKAPLSSSDEMKRGRFGMKTAKSMLPGEKGVNNPMKTFKSKNSLNSNLSKAILDQFRQEQAELRSIIDSASMRDIGAVKCKTTLPLIRFRLGDALEFIINHQVRHVAQAQRALDTVLSFQ